MQGKQAKMVRPTQERGGGRQKMDNLAGKK
jgi:hypothetical protein